MFPFSLTHIHSLWESYPSSHQDSLSRGVHPNDLMRVNPKPHPLRRHTSDRSNELHRTDYQKRIQQQKKPVHRTVSSNQITVRDTSRSSDYWKSGDMADGNHDYRPHPHSDQMLHNSTKPSSSSLDRYSEGSQSSYAGSSMEPIPRGIPPRLGVVDHTSYRSSPASSQSDYSDHYINSSSTGGGGGRYSR